QTQLARQTTVVGGNSVLTQPLRQVKSHAFSQPARIHKDQRGAMLLHKLANAVVSLVPQLVARHRTKLLSGNLDGKIELALVADVDHHRVGLTDSRQEMRYRFNRLLRGRKPDADRPLTGQNVQPLQ